MCSCDKHPIDALNEVNDKLALIADLTAQTKDNSELTRKSLAGLYWFLKAAEEAATAVLLIDSKKAVPS